MRRISLLFCTLVIVGSVGCSNDSGDDERSGTWLTSNGQFQGTQPSSATYLYGGQAVDRNLASSASKKSRFDPGTADNGLVPSPEPSPSVDYDTCVAQPGACPACSLPAEEGALFLTPIAPAPTEENFCAADWLKETARDRTTTTYTGKADLQIVVPAGWGELLAENMVEAIRTNLANRKTVADPGMANRCPAGYRVWREKVEAPQVNEITKKETFLFYLCEKIMGNRLERKIFLGAPGKGWRTLGATSIDVDVTKTVKKEKITTKCFKSPL